MVLGLGIPALHWNSGKHKYFFIHSARIPHHIGDLEAAITQVYNAVHVCKSTKCICNCGLAWPEDHRQPAATEQDEGVTIP